MMAVPREVIDLIERFARNRDTYRSHGYNETETRREFIDPFFKALTWDIDTEQGPPKVRKYAEQIGGLSYRIEKDGTVRLSTSNGRPLIGNDVFRVAVWPTIHVLRGSYA